MIAILKIDAGCKILDTGYKILDTGIWILDPGSWKIHPAIMKCGSKIELYPVSSIQYRKKSLPGYGKLY